MLFLSKTELVVAGPPALLLPMMDPYTGIFNRDEYHTLARWGELCFEPSIFTHDTFGWVLITHIFFRKCKNLVLLHMNAFVWWCEFPFSSFCTSCSVASHFLPICSFQNTHTVCAFWVIGSGDRASFALSGGFNQRGVFEPGQTNTHVYTQEMAGCGSGVLGHLEQPEHKRVHASAPSHNACVFWDTISQFTSSNSLPNHTLVHHLV